MSVKTSIIAFAASCIMTAATPLDLTTDKANKGEKKSPTNSRQELQKMCDRFNETSQRQYKQYRAHPEQSYEDFIQNEIFQDEMRDICTRRLKRPVYADNHKEQTPNVG